MAKSISLKRTGGILEDGVYKLRVKAMEFKKGAKSEYLACQFDVIGHGGVVFENLMLGNNVRFRLEPFMDAVEMPATGSMTPVKFITFCRGKVFFAKLTNETYQGRLKNVIATYLTADVAEQLMEEQKANHEDEVDEEEFEDEADTEEEEDDAFADDEDEEDDTGDGPKLPF